MNDNKLQQIILMQGAVQYLTSKIEQLNEELVDMKRNLRTLIEQYNKEREAEQHDRDSVNTEHKG